MNRGYPDELKRGYNRFIDTPVIHNPRPNDAIPAATHVILVVKYVLILLFQVPFEEKHITRIDAVKADEDVSDDGYESDNLGEGEVEEYVEMKGERSAEYSEIRVRETHFEELTRNQ